MPPKYEFWLTDDAGVRIVLFKNFAYASYSRTTRGYGTIEFGLPYETYRQLSPIQFQPDMRIDVWRSPGKDIQMRREGSFFLRKPSIYDREDGSTMIKFHGRSPLDILRRWFVSPTDATQYTKTGTIDDMMKAIVRDVFITGGNCVPAGEFTCDGDNGLGPTITQSFPGKNVLDVLTDLKATSFSLNYENPAYRRIFFDVVEGPGKANGFGYVFRTSADLWGVDRSNSMVFSTQNGNLRIPTYYEDYLDQVTSVTVNNTTVQAQARFLSRWNNIGKYVSSSSSVVAENTAQANKELAENAKRFSLGASFISTPGSPDQPRSLYGVDWDLGDLLKVHYAEKYYAAEVEIVWVGVNDKGEEKITGYNKVGE